LENEIGRIRKSDTTETVVRKTKFRGSVGIDIREYVTSERYTGWSKNGVRIPLEQWKSFKEILNKVDDGLQGEEDDQAGDV
jgi:Transcriptional Coactivator p15 (PC4).